MNEKVENPSLESQAMLDPPPEFSGAVEPQSTEQTSRDAGGRYLPGQPSPNPGGRPSIPAAVKALAREYTPEALQLLLGMARDPKVPADIRRRCCNDLLDRAWGKTASIVKQQGMGSPPAPVGAVVNISMQQGGMSRDQARMLIRNPSRASAAEVAAAEAVLFEAAAAVALPTTAPGEAMEASSNVVAINGRSDP